MGADGGAGQAVLQLRAGEGGVKRLQMRRCFFWGGGTLGLAVLLLCAGKGGGEGLGFYCDGFWRAGYRA